MCGQILNLNVQVMQKISILPQQIVDLDLKQQQQQQLQQQQQQHISKHSYKAEFCYYS